MDAIPLARAGAKTSFDVCISENLRSAEVDLGQIGQVLHNILLMLGRRCLRAETLRFARKMLT